MIRIFFAFMAIASAKAECSVPELKTAACWAVCRQDGFDSGYFVTKDNACWCVQKHKFQELTGMKLKIPSTPPTTPNW